MHDYHTPDFKMLTLADDIVDSVYNTRTLIITQYQSYCSRVGCLYTWKCQDLKPQSKFPITVV